jgi:hypothetical protein
MTSAGTEVWSRLVFFGMHPTMLPSSNRLFGGDVGGVASRPVEARLRAIWAKTEDSCGNTRDPLVGFVNTKETSRLSGAWVTGMECRRSPLQGSPFRLYPARAPPPRCSTALRLGGLGRNRVFPYCADAC